MPFDGTAGARWQIDILAADKTAQAFSSVDRRLKGLNVQVSGLQSGLTQQIAALSRTEASWGGVSRALGPIAGLLSAVNIAQRTWTAGMAAANLPDQAAQLATTADALQGFRAAAVQSGVEVGQFDAALQRLVGAMGAAKGGSDEAIERFDRLGVKLLDSQGNLRGVNDVLPEVARGLLRIGTEAERNALAQELFGRSGARTVTMLEQLAQGTDAVTEKARQQGMLVEGEYVEAWKKVDDQLKAFNLQYDTFLAKIGAPIATGALEHLTKVLESTRKEIELIAGAWRFIAGTRSLDTQIAAMNRDIAAFQERGHGPDSAALQDMIRRRDALQEQLNNQSAVHILPPVMIPSAPSTGDRNPTGKGVAKAGEDLAAKRLRESQKQLDEMFEAFEKIRKASEGVMDRFGDGTAFAAREMAELNEMLELGYIDAQTFAIAAADINARADEMDRAFRGAQGGVEGFLAGIEDGFASMARANSEFEIGRALVDTLSESIDALGGVSKKSFDKIALEFVLMVAKMQAAKAASGLFGTLGGGLWDALVGAIGGIGGSVSGPGTVSGGTLFFADGGRPPVGRASVVGERGAELFVPDRPGTIYNQEQLAAMGGGVTVIVQQHMQVGSFATRAEMLAMGQVIERSAREGAMVGVSDRRRRNDPMSRGR